MNPRRALSAGIAAAMFLLALSVPVSGRALVICRVTGEATPVLPAAAAAADPAPVDDCCAEERDGKAAFVPASCCDVRPAAAVEQETPSTARLPANDAEISAAIPAPALLQSSPPMSAVLPVPPSVTRAGPRAPPLRAPSPRAPPFFS